MNESAKAKTRRHTRRTIELRVYHESEHSLRYDECEDLSVGGIFVRTEKPLAEGTSVFLEIEMPGTDGRPIKVMGEVMWVVRKDEKKLSRKSPGMGIRFNQISEEDRRAIRKFLARL